MKWPDTEASANLSARLRGASSLSSSNMARRSLSFILWLLVTVRCGSLALSTESEQTTDINEEQYEATPGSKVTGQHGRQQHQTFPEVHQAEMEPEKPVLTDVTQLHKENSKETRDRKEEHKVSEESMGADKEKGLPAHYDRDRRDIKGSYNGITQKEDGDFQQPWQYANPLNNNDIGEDTVEIPSSQEYYDYYEDYELPAVTEVPQTAPSYMVELYERFNTDRYSHPMANIVRSFQNINEGE